MRFSAVFLLHAPAPTPYSVVFLLHAPAPTPYSVIFLLHAPAPAPIKIGCGLVRCDSVQCNSYGLVGYVGEAYTPNHRHKKRSKSIGLAQAG